MVIFKLLVLVLSVIACAYVIQNRLKMVQIFGRADWADRYLGSAYNLWVVVGLGMVFLAVTWLVGSPCDKKVQNTNQDQNY